MTKVPTERDAYEHGATRPSYLTGLESGADSGIPVPSAVKRIVDNGPSINADAWAPTEPPIDRKDRPLMDKIRGGR